MASFCRGFRQTLRCRGSILPFSVRSFNPYRLPLCFDSADPKPRFESPSLLQTFLLGKNSTDHIIHDQMRWENAHPSIPKDNLNLNAVKRRVREIPEASISYQNLLKLCLDCTKSFTEEEKKDIMKRLEQSGEILRIDQTVYPHPQQMARAVGNERWIEELREMEKERAEIEKKSQSMARKELWCGLGFCAIQTMGLFRLTFWELSWDVMEPICFYLTSVYFMLGYAFFLRTFREPSFENLYAARVDINRRKLMKRRNFDLQRYRDLLRICERRDEFAVHMQRKVFV